MAEKLTREELEAPDALHVWFDNAWAYVQARKKKILVALGTVLVLAVGAAGGYLWHARYEANAQQLYAQALDKALAGEAKGPEAIAAFRTVIDRYPRSRAATLVHYHLGNQHAQGNDLPAAIQAFEAFLAKAPAESDLTPLAWSGLGHCREAQGDFAAALAAFGKALAAKEGASFAGQTHRNLGRIQEKLKNPAKAREHYQKALEATKDPLEQILIKRKLAALQP